MKITVSELRQLIRETLEEIGGPKGKLRPVRGDGGRKVKLGKIEDENKELSAFEAEQLFPGATAAWAEVAPEMFPDEYIFPDPIAVKRNTFWSKVGDQLRVASKNNPQHELMVWDPSRQDWFDLEPTG